jgi:hypothetical protein
VDNSSQSSISAQKGPFSEGLKSIGSGGGIASPDFRERRKSLNTEDIVYEFDQSQKRISPPRQGQTPQKPDRDEEESKELRLAANRRQMSP